MKIEDFTAASESGVDDNVVRLIAILVMSNEAETAKDPFGRRIKLNEMQAAIQAARGDIEALAEGILLG